MHNDRGYLTIDLLSNVLSEFQWPSTFSLEDDLPDGIILAFPRSNFVFTEGSDGDVMVRFLSKDTGGRQGLHLGHALMVYMPLSERSTASITPGLIENEWPFPSEEKTKNGIRNACTIMLTHLVLVIDGDFSWVKEYMKSEETTVS
jgi:hypothetical protein